MINGEYYFGFMVTYLEDDYYDLSKNNKDKGKTYLHERIHYIQNTSTLYGINQTIGQNVLLLKAIENCRDNIYAHTLSEMESVVKASYQAPIGTTSERECFFITDLSYDDSYWQDYPNYKRFFEKPILLELDKDKLYYFGGYAVCESMAYQFEKKLYNDNGYEGIFPYSSCDKVYEYIMGRHCDNVEVMIALTYMSLMNKNPGNTFVDLLIKAKEGAIKCDLMQ